MAGVRHITIAPPLLRELSTTSSTDAATNFPSLFDGPAPEIPPQMSFINDEAAFRMGVTRNKNGANELKLVQVR